MPPPSLTSALPAWKRAIDLAFCLVALPVFALCALVMALLMRFTSPGPLLFTQERVGHNGRRFRIFKFRTMHVAASTVSHQQYFSQLMRSGAPMQKLDGKGDNRVIPGGWLIRAIGLDELPQLLNVVRGEMSVVGPRPCIPYEYEEYTEHQRQRFAAVPGLTGLWQVSGKNRTTFDEMIRLDIEYAATKSFWGDLRIIFSTPVALLTQFADTRRSRRAAQSTAGHAPAPVTLRPATAGGHSSDIISTTIQS